MNENQRKLKPYHGIILLIICALELFVISPFLSRYMGLYGTFLSEVILLGLSVLTVVVSGSRMKDAFPLRAPTAAKTVGTLLLWFGTFLVVMILTLIITALFPQQMTATSAGLGNAFTSVPFTLSLFIVAVTPAICEEAVFRGVVVHSFSSMNKWVIIVLTGLIFGAFHGSIWRFVPTAFLGMVLAYVVLETENMLYNGLFHCVNNAAPIILLYAMQPLYESMGVYSGEYGSSGMVMDTAAGFSAVGLYMIIGAMAPFCLYIGNYLLHRGNPGYREKLFPSNKPGVIVLLILLTAALFVGGMIVMLAAILQAPDVTNEIIRQVM
ncbi:MAG: type II CAAX endopeptidase family protein [Hespellia sp.]|nr:type II CAAX endopeptidase family protein [Hespellia sp.]